MTDNSADERFRTLFDAHHRAILGFFYRRLDPDEAFDATADVFLVAWRRLNDVPGPDDELRWLYGVSRRVLANYERSHRRSRRLIAKLAHTPHRPADGPEAVVVRRSEDQAVIDALAVLRPRDQEVLRLAYWDDLPHTEIASMLGCSRRAADVRIHRAVKRLRKEFLRSGHRGAERRKAQHEESQAW